MSRTVFWQAGKDSAKKTFLGRRANFRRCGAIDFGARKTKSSAPSARHLAATTNRIARSVAKPSTARRGGAASIWKTSARRPAARRRAAARAAIPIAAGVRARRRHGAIARRRFHTRRDRAFDPRRLRN
jgi:hypothetical protein